MQENKASYIHSVIPQLEHGVASPDIQRELARILEILFCDVPRKRGRPMKKTRTIEYKQLAYIIDWFEDSYYASGSTQPLNDAMEEALRLEMKEGRTIDIETIKRYYRIGCNDLIDDDIQIKNEIDKLSLDIGFEEALKEVSKKWDPKVRMTLRRYKRAKRKERT